MDGHLCLPERNQGSEILFGTSPCSLALGRSKRRFFQLFLKASRDGTSPGAEKFSQYAEERGIPVKRVQKKVLDALCKGGVHQGVCLEASPLRPLAWQEGPLHRAPVGKGSQRIWLVLEGIHDPMNLGAVLRTAHFLGVDGMVMSQRNSCSLTPVVSKASSGVMEVFDVFSTDDVQELLKVNSSYGSIGQQLETISLSLSLSLSLPPPSLPPSLFLALSLSPSLPPFFLFSLSLSPSLSFCISLHALSFPPFLPSSLFHFCLSLLFSVPPFFLSPFPLSIFLFLSSSLLLSLFPLSLFLSLSHTHRHTFETIVQIPFICFLTGSQNLSFSLGINSTGWVGRLVVSGKNQVESQIHKWLGVSGDRNPPSFKNAGWKILGVYAFIHLLNL
uniref:rRNA methyltransferase 1, mitochondrial n=1 Tax=Pseudonaja textilis TaxID=8673 RepID=A0A670Z1V7_PSETE